jgi:pyruvate/2-oxoglutarate dehydrogenase complex dihydrolipoamide dehydrogenase (E3) component
VSSDLTSEVDVIVLGVGTCGEDLSLHLLDSGLKVVGIEAALVGGECAYWACIPSKMMIRAANTLQEARRANGIAGQSTSGPTGLPSQPAYERRRPVGGTIRSRSRGLRVGADGLYTGTAG